MQWNVSYVLWASQRSNIKDNHRKDLDDTIGGENYRKDILGVYFLGEARKIFDTYLQRLLMKKLSLLCSSSVFDMTIVKVGLEKIESRKLEVIIAEVVALKWLHLHSLKPTSLLITMSLALRS